MHLSSLADYAAIVKHVMEAYNTTGPAYSIGGSYGGMLSALLRFAETLHK